MQIQPRPLVISKKKAFRLRFGQFKAAYGRQQITSSGAQQFVDRAQTDEEVSASPARSMLDRLAMAF